MPEKLSTRLALTTCAVLLHGCAATGPTFEVVRNSFPTVKEGNGRLFFYREYESFGAGMRPAIFACNKKVGESIPGGVFYVDLPTGECDVSIPTVLYGGERKLRVSILPARPQYIRTWIGGSGFGGRTNMELVPEEKANDAIKRLAFTK